MSDFRPSEDCAYRERGCCQYRTGPASLPSFPRIRSCFLRFVFASISSVCFLVTAAFAQSQRPASPGQPLFTTHCAGCHGLDGRGGEHAPDIATDPRIQNLGDGAIQKIVRDGLPTLGMPAFGTRLSAEQFANLIAYLRILQGKGKKADLAGDAAKGRLVFFETGRCATCHRLGSEGGFLGQELTQYGSVHTPEEIRTAIIEPYKFLSRKKSAVRVVTANGETLVGMARNEDNFSLQLQTEDGAFHFLDKSRLRKVEHEPRSLMPGDYGKTLTPDQLQDLVKFLSVGEAPTTSKP